MKESMYEKKILDAIQTLVDNAIDKASFDKTIKCIISKCIDEKNGKYVVIYQDSSFYAYSNDTTQIYNAGTPVYVLVPGNDMTQTKTILGSVNKLGSDYINTVEEINKYDIIGNNISSLSDEIGICSYKSGGDALVLYDILDKENAIVNIDTTAIDTYIKQSSYLILGGQFRTNLNKEQRYKGIYGLGFDLNFLDNMTGETVKRTYLVDINNMTGNPYEYTKASEQKIVFDIDGANFVNIDKIYLYCYDFPNSTIETKPNDIFLSDVIIEAATALSQDELAGNKLTLITPQGIYFDNNDSSNAVRNIETEVRIDNKIIDNNSSSLKYYWFKENYSINTSSLLYNRYGGLGWECLNNYNIVESDNNVPTLLDWITNQFNYSIAKSDVIARTTEYKCAVVYNNELVLTKQFTIYNYSSNYIVTIESDSGVYFSYDNGHPTLTCSVNVEDNYTYSWGMFDNANNFSSIAETTTSNTAYYTARNRYNEILSGLADGTIILTAAIQTELAQLETTLYQYTTTMRVEDNIIHNLKLNIITNFATFVCAVYKNGTYIGKGKIKIENDLNTSDNSYSLIINHGNQLFKYNEEGISPTNKSLENNQEIYPLSFTLFDEKGNEINNDTIDAKDVFWTVPSENTMIKVSAIHGNPISTDDFNKTETYTEYKELYFDIPSLYNSKNIRNTIELKIKYKNKNVIAKTDLMFLKEGEAGSNGTYFYSRIIPNNTNVSSTLQPIVLYDNNNQTYSLNFTPRETNVWFKVQLYRDGEEIFNSATTGTTTEGKTATVRWEILKNKYDTTHLDISNFSVNRNSGVFAFDNLSSISDITLKNNPSNIVKCTITYEGIEYIAIKPIVLVKVNNTSSATYRAEWEEDTGFKSVAYSSDGRTPQYSNALPFALKIYQTIDGVEEDISIATGAETAVNYTWSPLGLIWNGTTWVSENSLIEKNYLYRTLKRNEKYYKPKDSYNGLSVNNGLKCIITRSGTQLMEIYLPIYLYLNRYGKAALNGWNGNSIEINEDGGFILSPQIGAGKKESDNSYTGIFMGTVKETDGEEKTGLFGYNSGNQTIFLDAEDGSARLGTVGQGQIVIDPGLNSAKLYSDNYEVGYVAPSQMIPAQTKYLSGYSYWRKSGTNYTLLKVNRDYQLGDTIAASDYVWAGGSGLEIDLNDPHIRFGSGKFRVDSDGEVYATGFATVEALENGDYNIPGTNSFQAEFATDTIQFETDTQLYPSNTETKTISCKCLYKDTYTDDYTLNLIDNSGNVITHNTNSDGISIDITKSGNTSIITFGVNSTRQISNLINNYLFRFTYTPTGDTIDKYFNVNLVTKGTSISIKGSYDSLQDLLDAVDAGTVEPELGDGYLIQENLYIYTNNEGGFGTLSGDWDNVGQFKGEDAKICTIVKSSEAFKSTDGGNSYSPDSIDLTPYFQGVVYSSWSYSIDGGSTYTSLSSTLPTGITINSTTRVLTIAKDCTLFNSNSVLVFKCNSNDSNIYNTATVMRIKDGTNGTDGYSIWTTTSTPVTPDYTFVIANLVGPSGVAPKVGEIIIQNNRYQYTITSVSSTTVQATTRQDLKGSDGANGNNTATVNLYGRFVAAPSTLYSSAVAYTFSTQALSSIPTGWSQTIPAAEEGKDLYISSAVAYGNTDTTSIAANKWSTPRVLAENGTDGEDSTIIICGNEAQTLVCDSNGAVVSDTLITIPFAGYIGNSRAACSVAYGTLPGDAGEVVLVSNTAATTSADGNLVLKVNATAVLGNVNDGVIDLTFTCNSKTFVKKFNWAKALTGMTGYNTAIINLYKRSNNSSTLGRPYSASTVYTFATQSLSPSPSNNWSLTIPDGTETLYVCSAIAYSNTGIDGISSEEWSAASRLAQNGADGNNTAIINLYQRSISTPSAVNISTTYTFADQTLTPLPSGWSLTIPSSGDDPIYVTSAIAYGNGASVNLTYAKWSSPVKLVENGLDGESVVVDATTVKYQNSSSGTVIPQGVWNSAPSPVAGQYLWTQTTTTYKLATSQTAAGSSVSYAVAYVGNDGDQGTGIVSIVPLHYLKTSSGAPAAPAAHVTNSTTNPNVWTTAVPTYDTGATYYTCNEILYDDTSVGTDGYQWTSVVADNGINVAITIANTAENTSGQARTLASEAKITADEAKADVTLLSEKVIDVTNTVIGANSISLTNAYEGSLYKLSIWGEMSLVFPSSTTYPSETLYPKSTILLVDNNEFELDLNYLHYLSSEVYDEFVYENGKCKIIRRVGDNNGTLYALDSEVVENKKDIIIQVSNSSLIRMKSFPNLNYKAQYLLQNDYTDNFTTSLDLISRINLSPGTAVIEASKLAQITAEKIALEGYTTINDSFGVDLEGNMWANNGTFSGDVYLPEGGKVIGGDGLFTNLQYTSSGRFNGYELLGYDSGMTYSGSPYSHSDIAIDVDLPENFTVTSAYLTLYHTPVYWYWWDNSGNSGEGWGYSRNIRLYKVSNSENNFKLYYGGYGEYRYEFNSSDLEVIPNAFETESYTPSNTTGTTIIPKTTIDLKDYLNVSGKTKLVLRNNDSVPSSPANIAAYTGMARAVVNILGNIRLEREEEE